MVKKNFEDLIKDKLTNWEVDVPSDCWDAIERRLPLRKPFYSRPIFRYSAMAAALAGIIFAATLVTNEQNSLQPILVQEKAIEKMPEIINIESPVVSTPSANKKIDKINFAAAKETNNIKRSSDVSTAQTASVVSVQQDTETVKQTEGTATTENPTVATTSEVQKSVVEKKDLPTRAETQTHTYVSSKKERRSGFAVNLMASNALPGSTRENESNKLARNKVNGMQLFSSQQSLVKYDHKMPITAGITLEKKFTPALGLETGLNYSFLKSTFHSLESTTNDGKQELHYLGIPLNVIYRFAKWKNFSFYASAGGEVDFCISGKENYLNTNHTNTINKVGRDIKDKAQWSLHLKAGAAYALIRQLEIYAEPGMAYYFDNLSGVNTIWKDKPFNFALNLGLRTNF